MDRIFRIVFCLLSISFIQGKPTPTFDYDKDIIKDIQQEMEKLKDTSITCAKDSSFYSSDFTKECVDATLNCSISELIKAVDQCSGSEHFGTILHSLENLITSRQESKGTKSSPECKCEKQTPEKIEVFIENLKTGLQWIQS